MPYKSLKDVPKSLKSAGLTLAQANDWARYYDDAKDGKAENPAAVAWTRFKSKYEAEDDGWTLKKKEGNMTTKTEMNIDARILNFNQAPGKPLTFSFIMQTEGVHTGMSGLPLTYTVTELQKSIESVPKLDIKDDVMHAIPDPEWRPFNIDFAEVVKGEIIQINQEIIDKFKLNPTLLNTPALKCEAECYKPDYAEQIKRNKINTFSTEFEYDPLYDPDSDSTYVTNIKWTAVAAIRGNPADAGSRLLEVFNKKFGGQTMQKQEGTDGIGEADPKKPEGIVETPTKTPEDTTPPKGGEAQPSGNEVGAVKKPAGVEAGGEESGEAVEAKLKALEEEKQKLEKELDEERKKVLEFRDNERRRELDEVTSNDEVKDNIIGRNLPDGEFNKEVVLLKAIQAEANKIATEAAKKLAKPSDGGTAPVVDQNKGSFEKNWGGRTIKDVVEYVTGAASKQSKEVI